MNSICKILIAVLCIHLSCSNQRTADEVKVSGAIVRSFDEFPNTVNLTNGKKIHPRDSDVYKIGSMCVIDSLLLFWDVSYNTRKMIIAYNKNTYEKVGAFGIQGRGPGEIGMPSKPRLDVNAEIITIVDHSKHMAFMFNIDSALTLENYKPVSRKVAEPRSHALKVNHNLYYNNNHGSLKNFLTKHDLNTDLNVSVGKHINLPFGLEDIEKRDEATIITGIYSVKNDIIVYAYWYNNIISFLDTNSDSIKYIATYQPPLEHYKENNKIVYNGMKTPFSYKHVVLTNKYVYLDYIGGPIWNEEKEEIFSNEIHVFDYQGNPIKKLNIVNGSIDEFAVDEQSNKLIVSDPNLEDQFVEYNLD